MSKEIIRELTLLQSVINAIPTPLFFKDSGGIYLGCNQAFEEFVGKTRDKLIGKGVFELWEKSLAQAYFDADAALIQSGGKQVYEVQVEYADGLLRDVVFHKSVFYAKAENISGLVGVLIDVTERKCAENKLQKLAITDALTGLHNRHYLYEALDGACKRAKRYDSHLAVLFLDLDGFKAINDAYGHAVGDQLLAEVARVLRESVRESDLVARFGGDEFVIVLENRVFGKEKPEPSAQIAQKLIDSVGQPFQIQGETLTIGTSIGIARYPLNGSDSQSLIKHADVGLYEAKARGKGRYCCSTQGS
ncbi:MAG: diguanylate cyclase (GGDEF)-like protein/PAS domain S-box-containing protein [Motiliproteus sp.]|jgi:diguanylate cyclase (GGDEF)-like protein/PAS domain S-box-containing protein